MLSLHRPIVDSTSTDPLAELSSTEAEWFDGLHPTAAHLLLGALRGNGTSVVLRGDTTSPLGEYGGTKIGQVITHNPAGIRDLHLPDTGLKDSGVLPILEALAQWDPKKPHELKVLNVARNGISHIGAKAMATVFMKNVAICEVDLSNNNIGNEGAMALAEAIKPSTRGYCTVQKLSLRRCGISEEGVAALGQALCGNESMRLVNITGNRIGNRGAVALGEALRKTAGEGMGLTSLSIGDGFIDSVGMSELANCMGANETLLELRAGGNNFGDKAMSPVANALRGRSSLILLQLMGCHIGDGGAQTLATVLGSLRSLEVLNLSCNDIGNSGVSALSRGMEDNFTIRELSLHDNMFTGRGFIALAATLMNTKTLCNLDCAGNGLADPAAVRAICEALEVNASLLELDISRCEMQDTAAHFIIAAIEANRCLSVFKYERNFFSKETQDAIHYAMGRVRMGEVWKSRGAVSRSVAIFHRHVTMLR